MILEQQVVSLELAKKLKSLGVDQESYFYWLSNEVEWSVMSYIGMAMVSGNEIPENYSAFTVAELGEILKEVIRKIDCGDTCYDWTFESAFARIGWSGNNHEEVADTEADARAKMLIYLLENKFLD